MKKHIFAIVLGLFAVSLGAQAGPVVKSVTAETKSVIASFKKLEFAEKTQAALNALVGTAVKELDKRGHKEEALRFGQEWSSLYSSALLGIGTLDIGDHRPMSQWLADFYNTLEDKLGEWLMHQLRLDDIKIINYGIVVVFQPTGDRKTGDTWDSPEYKKHFVPFSAAVVYWASRLACSAATSGLGAVTMLCGVAAILPRYATEHWIAPPLSDWVYRTAHKQSVEGLDLGNIDRMLSQNEKDLEKQAEEEAKL
jgi:hypothetical protein